MVVVALSVSVPPAHTGEVLLAVISGAVVTVTVTVAVLVHPLASAPVTVYVVVTAGEAVTTAPVVADRPLAGLQL